MTLTDAQMRAMLTALTATGGPFDPAATYLGVATAIADHGSATVQADVTAPPGAAATRGVLASFDGPFKLSDGRWVMEAPSQNFGIASSADACILANWFLNSAAAAGTLKGFGSIFPTVSLVDQYSEFQFVFRLVVDPQGRWDASVQWNG